jgi:transposase, IS30 family
MGYRHLDLAEREELSRLLASGKSLRSIGRTLGRSAGALSRELARNGSSVVSYRAYPAQTRALRLSRVPKKALKLDQNLLLRRTVRNLLKKCWSPQQIARYLVRCYPSDKAMQVSHETIYTYLYVLGRGELKKELARYLRRHHAQRRPRKIRLKSCPIPEPISIEERPPEVKDRIVPGHWEGDLLVGRANGSVLGTLVERTTRFAILVPLKARDAQSVRRAFAREMKHLPSQLKKSLTYDHGQEMAQHRLFTKETKIKVYFAHPHCPWERGTNENTNGLLRQFFPKGTDFHAWSRSRIKHVQKLLNERPRKTLDWRAPYEAMEELLH